MSFYFLVKQYKLTFPSKKKSEKCYEISQIKQKTKANLLYIPLILPHHH